MTYKRLDSLNEDFRMLVRLLDDELAIRDGADHSFYSQFNKIDNIRNCLVCYDGEQPVGCGAFKPFDSTSVEIKRMFVLPDHRGRGVAIGILRELERWAEELSYTQCVLETGKRQHEAIKLYEKAGYKRIKNYGQYENVENSVCMKRKIVE